MDIPTLPRGLATRVVFVPGTGRNELGIKPDTER
jgi:hypothetical protein